MIARRSSTATGIATAAILLAVAGSPLGRQIWQGRVAALEASVSAGTPVAATAWLREHRPAGQLFNTYEWGDYLLWAGPPEMRVFVASHAHLVPRDVWRDYLRVSSGQVGWERILQTYDVETVVIDKRHRRTLIAALHADRDWHMIYEDPIAVIFRRAAPSIELRTQPEGHSP